VAVEVAVEVGTAPVSCAVVYVHVSALPSRIKSNETIWIVFTWANPQQIPVSILPAVLVEVFHGIAAGGSLSCGECREGKKN
jgi:hypothetical protein